MPDEVNALMRAAESGGSFRHLDGPARKMLYATAIGVPALRKGDLAALVPGSFRDLDGDDPYVIVDAKTTKGRKTRRYVLPRMVAELLRSWLFRRYPAVPVWPGTWRSRAAEMLRRDLKRAGIEYETADGVADFHGIRTSLGSLLSAANVPPKVVQALLGHASLQTTLKHYVALHALDVRGRSKGRRLDSFHNRVP